MRIKVGIYPCILMLISLLALSVINQYVPHHHHQGKFCVEITEDFAHDDGSDDNCKLESANIEYKGISKINYQDVPHPLYLTLLFSYFTNALEDGLIYPALQPESPLTPYSLKPNKLRGSPLFS